jgi:hypothetical protein
MIKILRLSTGILLNGSVNSMLELYILLFGIFQLFAGLSELFLPAKLFRLWKTWALSRLFPVHGFVLIAAGFPLIVFKGSLQTILFWVGVFMVLTGPFLMIYPEKIRSAFLTAEKDFTPRDLRMIVYVDSFLRIAVGILSIVAWYKSFHQ